MLFRSECVDVKAKIHNNGVIHAEAVDVVVSEVLGNKNKKIWQSSIGEIAAQSLEEINFQWTPKAPGAYQLLIEIDPENKIEEFDKDNNHGATYHIS